MAGPQADRQLNEHNGPAVSNRLRGKSLDELRGGGEERKGETREKRTAKPTRRVSQPANKEALDRQKSKKWTMTIELSAEPMLHCH